MLARTHAAAWTDADGLVETAERLGLARVDVEILHKRCLGGLAAVALEDGVVTAAESRDLESVAVLLGLPRHAVEEALADGGPARETWQLQAGDQVVFTGAMTPPREAWQAEARGRARRRRHRHEERPGRR